MSEIRAATVSNLAGTGPVTLTGQYAAKAWVNFNGTGTVAIRASGNVSSITDNGVGDYAVNFTAALTDANYAFNGTASRFPAANARIVSQEPATAPSTTALRVRISDADSNTARDADIVCVSVFR